VITDVSAGGATITFKYQERYKDEPSTHHELFVYNRSGGTTTIIIALVDKGGGTVTSRSGVASCFDVNSGLLFSGSKSYTVASPSYRKFTIDIHNNAPDVIGMALYKY